VDIYVVVDLCALFGVSSISGTDWSDKLQTATAGVRAPGNDLSPQSSSLSRKQKGGGIGPWVLSMHEGGDNWVLILVGKLQTKRTLGGLGAG
jgi:hypothetical protein